MTLYRIFTRISLDSTLFQDIIGTLNLRVPMSAPIYTSRVNKQIDTPIGNIQEDYF